MYRGMNRTSIQTVRTDHKESLLLSMTTSPTNGDKITSSVNDEDDEENDE